MVGLFDRHMIYAYAKAYIVCLVRLVGLFSVLDLFTNLDDFAAQRQGFQAMMQHIGLYYANTTPRIFDRLCEAIVLLAATFTVAMTQRNNELLPLLSAGVSTRRVVVPVLLAACAMLGLTVANQELVLPNIDMFLVENRANLTAHKNVEIKGIYDSNCIHISGAKAFKNTQTVEMFYCTIPPRLGRDTLSAVTAETAQYIPEGDGEHTGGWLLSRATPAELENWTHFKILEPVGAGRYFLHSGIAFQNA